MHLGPYITDIFLLSCLTLVWGKGAKVRVNKNRGGGDRNRDRGGFGGAGGTRSGGSDGSVSIEHVNGTYNIGSSDPDHFLPKYLFRNATHEERLLSYLFHDYDPVARAVMDTSEPVRVEIDFVLLRIHGLDERSQVLTTTGLVIAEWTDDRLMWDPEKFGNLTDIIIKADKLWLPELAVMNGADELIPDFDRIRVLLNYDGSLHWEPGGIFRTTCDIDIKYFPFDAQHCPLLIGAYSYYSSKMNITNASDTISTHDFSLNGEWHVYATSAHWNITVLECCPGKGYPHVIFTLHLKRRYKFYIMNIVLPCLMLSVLIMIGFLLPPDAGEKISLGISVLLAFTVFLLMIADNIPRTSLAIPLMVIYLTATMTLGTISICMTVLVLNVHHRGAREAPPMYMKKIILAYMARILCIKTSLRSSEKVYAKSVKHKKLKGVHDGNGMIDEMELLSLTVANSTNSKMSSGVHINGPRTMPGSPLSPRRGDLTPRVRLHQVPERPTSLSGSEELADYSKEWHEMAHVLDRLFFWVLFWMMTASSIFILLYPKYTGLEQEIYDY